MPLTTNDGTKLGQSIVTDVNANVPTEAPAARTISPEAALLFNKAIVARPLMAPEVCSLKVKNHEYRYRWVNRDGMGGRIYTQRRAQGFINADNNDVEVLAGDAVSKDGEIRAGDLILMKIRAELYDAAIKWNMQKASALARARGTYLDNVSSDVNSDAVATRHTMPSDLGKHIAQAKPFIPDNPDQIIQDSISSGRVEDTRKTMDELRSRQSESKKNKEL